MEYIVKLIMKGKGNEFKNNPNLEGVWQLTETHEVSELCFNGLKEVIKTEEVVNKINITRD